VDLLTTSSDYPDGACSAGGDLWVSLSGSSALPVFTNLTISAIATNAYFYDGGANADATSYNNLKGKFLGVNAHPEQLRFVCPSAWAPAFVVDDTRLASVQVQGGGGTNAATLNGLSEGETFLFAKSGGSVVGYLKLQSRPRRTMKLSYAYLRIRPRARTGSIPPTLASAATFPGCMRR